MQPQHKPCSSTESNNPIYQRSYRASCASINLCESVRPSVCSARRSFENSPPPLLDITTHSLPISFLYRRRIHIQYFNLMYSNPHELKTGREGSSGKNNSLIRFMNHVYEPLILKNVQKPFSCIQKGLWYYFCCEFGGNWWSSFLSSDRLTFRKNLFAAQRTHKRTFPALKSVLFCLRSLYFLHTKVYKRKSNENTVR